MRRTKTWEKISLKQIIFIFLHIFFSKEFQSIEFYENHRIYCNKTNSCQNMKCGAYEDCREFHASYSVVYLENVFPTTSSGFRTALQLQLQCWTYSRTRESSYKDGRCFSSFVSRSILYRICVGRRRESWCKASKARIFYKTDLTRIKIYPANYVVAMHKLHDCLHRFMCILALILYL